MIVDILVFYEIHPAICGIRINKLYAMPALLAFEKLAPHAALCACILF